MEETIHYCDATGKEIDSNKVVSMKVRALGVDG